MKKQFVFFILILLLGSFSYAYYSSSSINFLSKQQADTLYCPIGNCSNSTGGDNTYYVNNTYINIESNTSMNMGAIADSNKYALYLNGVLVMNVNQSGTFLKGDIYTNDIIDINKSNTFNFYVNGSVYAQINISGDLLIKNDIYTNEVLN